MQELELYEWTGTSGSHGHVSGHSEPVADERRTRRGIGDIKDIKPLPDEPIIPGWPMRESERKWFQQLMLDPGL